MATLSSDRPQFSHRVRIARTTSSCQEQALGVAFILANGNATAKDLTIPQQRVTRIILKWLRPTRLTAHVQHRRCEVQLKAGRLQVANHHLHLCIRTAALQRCLGDT